MLNMIKWNLYSLAAYLVVGVVAQAQQPDGYLGCFIDSRGNSLITSVRVYRRNNTNTGELCKTTCKTNAKRFAGAKERACYCGDGIKNNTDSTTCNTRCPGNDNELCGNTETIIIYDTWKCITGLCHNELTCEDIDAENFRCNCNAGWTGTHCNETVTSTTKLSTQFSTSSPVTQLPTTSVLTTQLTTEATSALTTTTLMNSFTISTTSEITVTNATVTTNNSIFSDNPSAQTSTTKLAVYISVPLTVVAVVAVTIFLIIIKKYRNPKMDDTSVIYKKSDKASHTFSAVANKAYNDQDNIQSDIPVYINRPARNMANSENVGNTEESNYHYETTDDSQWSVSNDQIPLDEYGYGHLKSMTSAVSDPTYSHTQNSQSGFNQDYTYSHALKTTGKPKSDETMKADNDTYSHMDKSAGKLNAGVTVIATDDTYSKINNHGTKVIQHDKQTELVLNEPEYDHTDFGKQS